MLSNQVGNCGLPTADMERPYPLFYLPIRLSPTHVLA